MGDRKIRIVSTKKNKFLEPMGAGNIVIGYNEEIHYEDSIIFSYKLPLGAIKRLIRSYFEDIESVDEEWVYFAQTGSWENRIKPYCYRMIDSLSKQLDKNGFNGKKIIDDVFDQYFKDKYEKMKRFKKNHGIRVMEDFKRCKDAECCKPLTTKQQIISAIGTVKYQVRRLKWFIKRYINKLKDLVKISNKGGEN